MESLEQFKKTIATDNMAEGRLNMQQVQEFVSAMPLVEEEDNSRLHPADHGRVLSLVKRVLAEDSSVQSLVSLRQYLTPLDYHLRLVDFSGDRDECVLTLVFSNWHTNDTLELACEDHLANQLLNWVLAGHNKIIVIDYPESIKMDEIVIEMQLDPYQD